MKVDGVAEESSQPCQAPRHRQVIEWETWQPERSAEDG